MKKILLLFVCVFLSSFVSAQVILENNPPGLRWYRVNTPNFRILYPEGFESQAQRVANTLEHIREPEARSMGTPPRRISVILQNQSAVSNGFVSVLPRRSEFYAMPSQNYNFVGTNDWLEFLASHEYRHIVQYQHAKRGFNKLVYYLFGNPTFAGLAQAAAPDWFWEGDAVLAETAFTPSGRGRIPNFGIVFKTNLLEGRTFNYHKQYLRSYKHNIPNHYVLGYYMTSYLRKRTNDPDIWEKITRRSWSVPFVPFAFSSAIKNKSGLTVTRLYKEMAADLKKNWQAEIAQLPITTFETVNRRKRSTYTDYMFPAPQEDGSVIAMRKGIGDIEQFVRIRDGKAKVIKTPGFLNETAMLSIEDNTIVWNEYHYHPRWQVKNYSLVKAYHLPSRTKYVVSDTEGRFGGAAISSDRKIVTVFTDESYKHTLMIVRFPDGIVLDRFPNPENHFYSMPRFGNDGRIVALRTSKAGKTIVLIDPTTKKEEDLLPVSHENLGHPVLVDSYVFFNSPAGGIDNIHVLDLNDRRRYQVTVSKYGAYNPAVTKDRKAIYYNEQTKNGLDVVRIPFDPSLWKPYNTEEHIDTSYAHLVEQEGNPDLLKTIPDNKFPVTRYRKIRGLINPFSWGAFLDETDLTRVDIGITSRDVLSTTNITAGYTFDVNERTGFWRSQLSYQGWFPIIDLEYRKGQRKIDEGVIPTRVNNEPVLQNLTFDWNEETIEAGVRIPLVTTTGRFAGNVAFGNHVAFTTIYDFTNSINGGGRFVPAPEANNFYVFNDYADNGKLTSNHFSFTAYRLLKQSRRDIFSKWGQYVSMDLYNTLSDDFRGSLFSFFSQGFFPGLFKHHSLYAYWAYQKSRIDRQTTPNWEKGYRFRNNIPLVRGIPVAYLENFFSMSANYTMPVWYPDIAIGPLLNIQRFRTNVFIDYTYGFGTFSSETAAQTYLSTGIEVKADINVMRFLPQLDIGFRYTYGLSHSVTDFEILIGTFNF